jgi:hypothetical protein
LRLSRWASLRRDVAAKILDKWYAEGKDKAGKIADAANKTPSGGAAAVGGYRSERREGE